MYLVVQVSIYETFSKRLKKRERVEQTDVYQYDNLPEPLRVQITHIWRGMFGYHHVLWGVIHDTLAREIGVFHLRKNQHAENDTKCIEFLLTASTLEALDIIELSFVIISNISNFADWSYLRSMEQQPDDAIDELNYRFREHGVGYQFENGEILRVDSQYIHAEIVKPAIHLLNAAGFEGALEEFLKAHEHYRKGRIGEAMSEALKSFESTMKAICDNNGWSYKDGNAKTLIKVVLDNKLIPKYMETHLSGLRSSLEAGLPTLRNKNSGHGQGIFTAKVPSYFAGYALHLAATNILFLVEAHKALNSD